MVEKLGGNAAARAFEHGHFLKQEIIQPVAAGGALAHFARAHFQALARHGAFQTAFMAVIHIDSEFFKGVLNVDKLAKHHFRVVFQFIGQRFRGVERLRTDAAAAVVWFGKAGESDVVGRVNFGRGNAVAGKQGDGVALVAALADERAVGHHNLNTCCGKACARIGQLEQLGVDGGNNQADILGLCQFKNAVDIIGR